MADVNDLLNEYINSNPATAAISSKISAVTAASESKKALLDQEGYIRGAARDVGYGMDFIDPSQPEDIAELMMRGAGDARYMRDATHSRSLLQATGDNLSSAGQALFMTPV